MEKTKKKRAYQMTRKEKQKHYDRLAKVRVEDCEWLKKFYLETPLVIS